MHEAKGLRWLSFGDGGLQSAIDPSNTSVLAAPLNQAMLASLLFMPAPQQVLLLGTGGGAVARFFADRAATCQGAAVELSATVAKIAQRFFDFPKQEQGWTLHTADARDYIANTDKQHDLILLDIAEGQRTTQWVYDTHFLEQCRKLLTATGALVVTLIPHNAENFVHALTPIRQTFPLCTACLSVPDHHNILVFAFREPPDYRDVESRIPQLTRQWGLPFTELLARLRSENPAYSGIF